MKVNKTFIDDYLLAGRTYDNYVFENCPIEFLKIAKESLNKEWLDVYSCNIVLTEEIERKVQKTLDNCEADLQKTFIARDYVCTLIMLELAKKCDSIYPSHVNMMEQGIKAIYENEFWKVKNYHKYAPYPTDILEWFKDNGRFEINFFLIDTKNKYIQRAINNFISQRAPYSVKVFTNNVRLPSYQDEAGNLIKPPHDYITMDVNKFIENEKEF